MSDHASEPSAPSSTAGFRLKCIAASCSFILVLAAPMAAWVAFGPSDPMESRAPTEFPEVSALLSSDTEPRQQFSGAIFERNLVKRTLLSARYSFSHALGIVDTEQVVSGDVGWLFYKPALTKWACENERVMRQSADRLRLLAELSQAGDIPLAIVMVPNKASVYRGQVRRRAAAYLGCYDEISQIVRRLGRTLPQAHFIDHADVLQAWVGPGLPYYMTDTHWTPAGAATALNQLLAQDGLRGIQPVELRYGENRAKSTDLGGMLLLGLTESTPSPELPPHREVSPDEPRRTIIHDSFYESLQPNLTRLDRNITLFNMNSRADLRGAVADADLIVFARAERFMVSSAFSPVALGWGGAVSDWLLQHSAARTERCDWSAGRDLLAVDGEAQLQLDQLERLEGDQMLATGDDPKIIVRNPYDFEGREYCLRARIVGRGKAQLFLRDFSYERPEDGDIFTQGRSIEWRLREGEPMDLSIVLPASGASGWRLDPVVGRGPFALQELRIAPMPSLPALDP